MYKLRNYHTDIRQLPLYLPEGKLKLRLIYSDGEKKQFAITDVFIMLTKNILPG